MIGLFSIILLGFFLGMRHATDPDHVIAVSTIVTREHNAKRSALIGAAWGVGHTLTILAVGGAIILFRFTLPPRLGLSMELAVGLMLIVLGARNISVLTRKIAVVTDDQVQIETRTHAHGDYVHTHHHAQSGGHLHNPQNTPVEALDRRFQKNRLYQFVRPLIIGTVHGMAGSAAIALLVLSTIQNLRWELIYLAVFGLGTILGMMLITLVMGSTFAYGQKRSVNIGRHFGLAAGVISLIFGLFIAYQIGFVDGLFTSHANWTPR